jgi:hypothetical protein
MPSPKLNPKPATVDGGQAPEPYGWFLHPVVDLILVCGGLVWIITLLMSSNILPDLTRADSKLTAIVSYLVLGLFIVPHGMATYFRVYDVEATRKVSGKKVAYLALLCLGLAVIAGISPFWTSVIGRLTICLSFQHGFAQAYGIALIYCYKRKYFLNKTEKAFFYLIVQAGILLGTINCLSNNNLIILNSKMIPLFPVFPSWVIRASEWAMVSSVLAFAVVVARKYFVEKRMMPLPAILTTITSVYIFAFVMPGASRLGGYFIVLYALAHGIFHTPQYLVVTTSVHLKNQGLPESLPVSQIARHVFSWTGFKYFLSLYSMAVIYMAGGALILVLSSRAGLTPPIDVTMVAFFSAMNLHHYFSDMIVWRLRDKENTALLLS